jgi:hypothetical protein
MTEEPTDSNRWAWAALGSDFDELSRARLGLEEAIHLPKNSSQRGEARTG